MVITLLILLSPATVAHLQGTSSPVPRLTQQRLEPNHSNETWQPIFFKEIDKRAKIAGLPGLRSVAVRPNDFEIRFWIGFGLIPLEGFVIKRQDRQWSALHLRSIAPNLSRRDYQQKLSPPPSGWDEFWTRLGNEGILTLPDSSQLKDEVFAADGESFVVEVRTNRSYRSYRYSNPHLQKWPEAKHVIRIAEIILAEFNIQRRLLAENN